MHIPDRHTFRAIELLLTNEIHIMLFVLMEFRSFRHEFIWTPTDGDCADEGRNGRRKPWSKSKINPKRIAGHGAMSKDKWLMILARQGKSRGALSANNAFAEDIVVLTLTANMISAQMIEMPSALWIRAYIPRYNDDGSRM